MDAEETLDRLWEHSFEALRRAEAIKWDDKRSELERRRAQGQADTLRVILLLLRENPQIVFSYDEEWREVRGGTRQVGPEMLCPIDRSVMNLVFQDADRRRYRCTYSDELADWEHQWDFDWQGTWTKR